MKYDLCNFDEAIAAYEDVEIVSNVARAILEELPGAVDTIQSAIVQCDRERLEGIAHRLVASAANVRAHALQRELQQLEKLAGLGSWEAVSDQAQVVVSMLERFRRELVQFTSE